jgi:protein phosphatase
LKLSFTKYSDVGLARSNNEDFCGVKFSNNGVLAVVCDGVGGNNGGEVASRLACEVLFDSFTTLKSNDFGVELEEAIKTANISIKTQAKENYQLMGMASTIVAVYIRNSTVYWGHVGDSRIYSLINNELTQITTDHSLVQEMVDKGYLTVEEAENHPKKNIITRALGTHDTVKVDIGDFKINEEDKVLIFLCTDGVTNVVDNEQLSRILSTYNSNSIVKELYHTIRQNGAPDNFTFALITNLQ